MLDNLITEIARMAGQNDRLMELYEQSEEGEKQLKSSALETLADWLRKSHHRITENAQRNGAYSAKNAIYDKLASRMGWEDRPDSEDEFYTRLDRYKEKLHKASALIEGGIDKHPDFGKALQEKLQEKDAKVEEFKNKYEQLTKQVQVANLQRSLREQALSALSAIRANLGGDEAERGKRLNAFYKMLEADRLAGRFRLENGQLVVLNEQGEAEMDAYLQPIDFKSYIANINPYGVHNGEPEHSGAPQNGSQPRYQHVSLQGKSADELFAMMQKEKNPKRNEEIELAWLEARHATS